MAYTTFIRLSSLLRTLRGSLTLTYLLADMFQTPGPWLPENVGSVLLSLGQRVTREYLFSLLSRPAEPDHATRYKPVATALTGLAVMTARFLSRLFQRTMT